MDMYRAPASIVIQPSIPYFGTPVVLITTRNPDRSTNITPMSSAWALADRVVIGLSGGGQGLANLLRERECVLNLASADQHGAVERLAPTKFALAGWHALPSQVVAAARIAECPLQLEARLCHALPRPLTAWRDRAGGYTVLELEVVRVHAQADIVLAGTQHIDPSRYHPLFYVFRHYFGRGPRLGRTFKAEGQASAPRQPRWNSTSSGRCRLKPCARLTPSAVSACAVSASVTHSATTSRPSRWAMSVTARTIR